MTRARGLARLRWDSVAGADAYIVVRDDREITAPLRIEGSRKEWQDREYKPERHGGWGTAHGP